MTALSKPKFHPLSWRSIVTLTLAAWLGGSCLLDFVVMPGLYASGMMAQDGFAAAGYSIFGAFSHIEVFCAALVLTSILALNHQGRLHQTLVQPVVAGLLLVAALTLTYVLVPEMSALSIHLDWLSPSREVPAAMGQMHSLYFGLELLKLAAVGWLLSLFVGREEATAS